MWAPGGGKHYSCICGLMCVCTTDPSENARNCICGLPCVALYACCGSLQCLPKKTSNGRLDKPCIPSVPLPYYPIMQESAAKADTRLRCMSSCWSQYQSQGGVMEMAICRDGSVAEQLGGSVQRCTCIIDP